MQKESASPAPTPIPIPDDFPVIWLDPEDAALTWNQEGTHFPESMPPLEFDFWNCAIHGIYDLQERFSAPHRLVIRYFNTYFYMGERLVVAEEEKLLTANDPEKSDSMRSGPGQGGFGGGRRPGGERPPENPRPRRDDI